MQCVVVVAGDVGHGVGALDQLPSLVGRAAAGGIGVVRVGLSYVRGLGICFRGHTAEAVENIRSRLPVRYNSLGVLDYSRRVSVGVVCVFGPETGLGVALG